jgi:signal transduction histidine kinase
LTCLAVALLSALAFQAADPTAVLWPAMIAVLPMIALLVLNRRAQTWFTASSYLAIGGACTYWYLLTFFSQTDPILASDAFSTTTTKVALLMVAGPGLGLARGAAWMTAGFVVGETASAVAMLQSGLGFTFDPASLASFATALAFVTVSHLSLGRFRQAQPLLHRSVRDEQLATMRYRIETKAAALMHDTVLSHLAALGSARDGDLDQQLRRQISRDLEVLIGEEWLNDELATHNGETVSEWQQSGLRQAIEEARGLGLDVESTGDLAVVASLGREASIALGQAAKQCLVNVLRHSGTTKAEVVVYGTGDEVSVMIIDAGKGFSVAETGADRLGLRNSVRKRIELIGGTVQVWSTPGHGTSIMIQMPVVERDTSVQK